MSEQEEIQQLTREVVMKEMQKVKCREILKNRHKLWQYLEVREMRV